MKVTDISRINIFYITTDEGKLYKRIPDGQRMDNDLWFLLYNGIEVEIIDKNKKQELKEAFLKYTDELFDAGYI